MALNTFADPKVRAALSQAVLVRADVTQNSPTDQVLLRQFDLIGPSAILFFGPDQLERNLPVHPGFARQWLVPPVYNAWRAVPQIDTQNCAANSVIPCCCPHSACMGLNFK